MSSAAQRAQPLGEFPAGSPVGRRLALIYQVPAFVMCFILFALFGILLTISSGLLYFVLPPSRRVDVGQRIIHSLFRFFVFYVRVTGMVKVDFSAIDAVHGAGPMIIAPNHPCLLDAVFIISRLPRVACVMKAKILDNPVLGGGARLAGYIRNDSAAGLINGALKQLAEGNQILLFPEGTRTVQVPLNELKGGFAMIATKAAVPVQIIRLEASSRFLGKGWCWARLPAFPLHYRAILGERLMPEPGESTRVFLERVRISMLRTMPEIGSGSS